MPTERSLGSTMLSSRKKVTRPSTRSASLGLWSSMLKGPRTPPKTLTTLSTTAWCSAGTSDFPATGATRGMMDSFPEDAVDSPLGAPAILPAMPEPVLATTVVGSYPQPDWLVDREMLAKGVPRVRLRGMWRIPEAHLEQAQDDATIVAIRAMERAGID